MSNYPSDKILQAKNKLDQQLAIFIDNYPNNKRDKASVQRLVTDLITEHSNTLSTVNIAIGETHQERDFYLSKDLQDDFLNTIENFLPVSFQTIDTINGIIKKHQLTKYSIGKNSYETIQRFVNTFAESSIKEKTKIEFEQRDLSTNGFNKKFKRMKDKYLRTQLYVGIPILLLSVVIIFMGELFLGKPFNGIQLTLLKALISLSISIVGSSLIEGNVQTKWTLQKGLTIRAVGWVAIFLLLYFVNPSNPGEMY